MPYNPAQCRKFAAMAARGEPVPADWRSQCRGVDQPSRKKKAKHKPGRKR